MRPEFRPGYVGKTVRSIHSILLLTSKGCRETQTTRTPKIIKVFNVRTYLSIKICY